MSLSGGACDRCSRSYTRVLYCCMIHISMLGSLHLGVEIVKETVRRPVGPKNRIGVLVSVVSLLEKKKLLPSRKRQKRCCFHEGTFSAYNSVSESPGDRYVVSYSTCVQREKNGNSCGGSSRLNGTDGTNCTRIAWASLLLILRMEDPCRDEEIEF